jgi:hypothetical protein
MSELKELVEQHEDELQRLREDVSKLKADARKTDKTIKQVLDYLYFVSVTRPIRNPQIEEQANLSKEEADKFYLLLEEYGVESDWKNRIPARN